MKINKLYKNILLLVIVLAPGFWLTMTIDGQRRTDALLLHLFGQKAIELNLAELDNNYSEQQWKQVYEDLDWHCDNKKTAFGEQSCVARIGSFNEIPANYIVAYFVASKLNALKLEYRKMYHDELLTQIRKWLGDPNGDVVRFQTEEAKQQVLRWPVKDGIVILKKQLESGDEPVLIWLSSP